MVTVTDMLNYMDTQGVFSYVLPFLLIFAIIFAILDKSKILGENKGIMSIVGLAIGLLALQFDMVSMFFANIFPKFGVVLAVFLVLVILIGFFVDEKDVNKKMGWIGILLGVAVVVWAFFSWNQWGGGFGTFGFFWQESFPLILTILAIGGIVFWVVKASGSSKS